MNLGHNFRHKISKKIKSLKFYFNRNNPKKHSLFNKSNYNLLISVNNLVNNPNKKLNLTSIPLKCHFNLNNKRNNNPGIIRFHKKMCNNYSRLNKSNRFCNHKLKLMIMIYGDFDIFLLNW